MVVIVLENVAPSLRGEMTRWMLEVHAGVFAGELPASVRERLWEMACQSAGLGGCILLHSTDSEQGFVIRMHGPTRRSVEDFEGLNLVRMA